ncbi:MAG: DUF2892 domain-containing protein [Puia sp.]|nr:DUF2892 domain-containing protein [Puia sp.]
MKKNTGITDRVIRFVLAVILIDIASGKTINGIWDVIAWTAAAILLITAVLGRCPLYSLFGISTCPRKKTIG